MLTLNWLGNHMHHSETMALWLHRHLERLSARGMSLGQRLDYRANAPRRHISGDALRHKSAALRGIKCKEVSGFAAGISGRIE
ncbi:hypothetical protein ALO68_02233 [Pseudomonas syringae pv. helianthi]|uniref:Uncharacterized protein n=1 Tax=Pseudomonas syringae pv. helianthi TaxID=251654 RepID=A0A0P9SXQ1_9PSED|nr:hypothetical protein ALO68_02233 [Pseudomonas syringae pv. helianthi]RMR09428.1 hypothetical protein ALP93_01386 [Pseudomonas syringae pv. helianthi]